MIKIVEGDLLQATEDIIGHQVNCKGVMGSGVALQVKNTYSHAYEVYFQSCEYVGADMLGTCQIVKVSESKFIANLFGQNDYGRHKQQTDYAALENSLKSLKDKAQDNKQSIALPFKIGSDRGGADWNEVYKIIDDVFSDYEVTLYKFEVKR